MSKWQGESERLVRTLFEMARESPRAIIFIDGVDALCGSRSKGGDNSSQRNVTAEFLTQMQGVGKTGSSSNVLVIAATDLPWDIDIAMLWRFQKRVYIPLPDAKAREEMVKIHLGDTPNNLSNADFGKLGEETEGFSGSDIKVLVNKALMEPWRRCKRAKQFKLVSGFYVPCGEEYPNCDYCPKTKNQRTCTTCRARWMQIRNVPKGKLKLPDVEMRDFVIVLKNLRASVPKDKIEDYEQWTTKLGQSGRSTTRRGDDDDSDDDEDSNRRYVGGIDAPGGLAVLPNPNELRPSTGSSSGGGGTGAADLIFGMAESSSLPSSSNSGWNGSGETSRRTITMYRSGCTVDDGPYRRLDDVNNTEFLTSLARGRIPRELQPQAQQGGDDNDEDEDDDNIPEVMVGLVDRRTWK